MLFSELFLLESSFFMKVGLNTSLSRLMMAKVVELGAWLPSAMLYVMKQSLGS